MKHLCLKMAANASAGDVNQYAVLVSNARKSYGAKPVLNDFCMKVPRGCIYGLLGASGCGKTTLLSCVVGRKQLDSGDVFTLGGKPGTPGSGVPGPSVGYMPQEIALVAEFTVRDAVYYFGRILNMDDWLIEERFQKLKVLLDLPPDDRQLKNCSGGQQRRVSFAAAMVHKPQLLILDEPTVGLDPVLRDSIWNHLVEIAEKENTAIIITTHYIEEARQAHKIGLMREGRLLAEESPERLLQLFNTETLEEVFLILSRRQEEGRLNQAIETLADEQNNTIISRAESNTSVMTLPIGNNSSTDFLAPKKPLNNTSAFSLNKHRMKSLMTKNIKQFLRNYGGMSFTFIFPILEILAFLMAVGSDPKDIKLAIINDEARMQQCSNYSIEGTAVPYSFSNCNFTNLACRFIDEIENPMFEFKYYDSLETAFDDIKHGEIVGVLYMASNFSEAYSNRVNNGRQVSDADIDFGEIKVWLDMSNRQIGASVKARLFRLFQDFQVSAFKDCQYNELLGRVPLRFTFEFGVEDEDYTNYMIPGVLLTVMFFLGATLTSTIIVTDRQEGVWDRSIVAGVTSLEIVVTHFATQFCLVVLQTCELIVLTFVIYDKDFEGDMWLIFLFTLFQGVVGMVFGFWISVVSDNHTAANIVCTGMFYPMIVLCGLVWPLEAQPDGLRHFSKCLPFTLPIVSLRQVIKKGYGMDEWQVLDGLGITVLWILILSVISVLAIKASR